MVSLKDSPIGTAHDSATCSWCGSKLVIAEVLQLRCWLCPIDWRRQVKHALIVKADDKTHAKLLGVPVGTSVCLDVPLPSQILIEDATAKNVLWGGQAGPGKSHGIRKWLYRRSLRSAGHEALLLRENWDQLDKTHIRRMQAELPLIDARMVDRTAVFPNGSFIDCGHMADADSVNRYLSTEYGAIVPDEASVYPLNADGVPVIAELSSRARKEYTDLEGRTVGPRFVPVTNPGGPSAGWLRDMFVDHTPDLELFPALADEYDPNEWLYIPAKLDDNPYMRPSYAKSDLAVLSKWRYEQLRHGDWHVFAGQFFSQWAERLHVRDLDLPDGLTWVSSMDWGSNSPGCVGYYCVLPDKRLYRRSEIKFQHAHVVDVVDMMRKREKELGIKVSYRVGDPAMGIASANSKKPHGESIADTFRMNGITMRPGDNERNHGWTRCLQLLREAPDGDPWFMVHSDCRYFIRTVAAARSDKSDPDDVDTTCDDHALDEWRYFCMSRPSPIANSKSEYRTPGSIGWWKARVTKTPGVTRGVYAAR